MQKQVYFKIKGMNRDLSESVFNPEFAYENKNIRILSTDDNTLLSLTNEQGTKEITVNNIDSIEGTPIGTAIIDNKLILFTTKEGLDSIYKIYTNDLINFEGELLYSGNLNFSISNPIETLVFYENEDIQKVYWVDGKNQPRVINVVAPEEVRSKWNDYSFDFISKLQLKENITISKNEISSGMFPAGVIQYAFSYYNKYGRESNIFYTSPLYYVSFENRGASAEDKVSNSFTINIDNLDTSFDYIRVYSILRTSIDATPEVKRVVDLAVTDSSINYTDTGTYGDSVDPTELLFIGGEDIISGTISQKDNTLFLGNITLNKKILDSDIRDYFSEKVINFKYKSNIKAPNPSGLYPYESLLKYNSLNIKSFKYLEWYRFGVQFQHYNGKWSEPIWINDAQNNLHINCSYTNQSNISLPIAYYNLNDSTIINSLVSKGYIRVRPVIVYPELSDRECICQGVLCPTVFNTEDRYGNSPFAQSSWFVRANAPFDIPKSANDILPLNSGSSDMFSIYSKGGVLSNKTTLYEDVSFTLDTINKGRMLEFRHQKPIPSNEEGNAEIQCIVNPPECTVLKDKIESEISGWVSENKENFYIDQSIVTLHSPDIEFNEDLKNIDTSNLKLRIVGFVPLTSFSGSIDIQSSTPPNNIGDTKDIAPGFYKEPMNDNNISYFGFRSMAGAPFWFDELSDRTEVQNTKRLTTAFMVYPFHRNGSLNNTKFPDENGYRSAMLEYKKLSNIRYSYNSSYLDTNKIYTFSNGISGVSIFDSNEIIVSRIPSPKNSNLPDINYYGNVDKVITVSRYGDKKDGYPIIAAGVDDADENAHKMFTANLKSVKMALTNEGEKQVTNSFTGLDPIRMKYKSTPHAVLALNYTSNNYQVILPTCKDFNSLGETWTVNSMALPNITQLVKFYWDKDANIKGIYQDVIDCAPQYGFLWLGELYNDNVINRFGGQTEEAFENNKWLSCGEPILLVNDNTPKSSVEIQWTEGDTYYQRYDHIKTYPFTLEDQNAITDIVSFMCETRVNIDGRYDKNRGQTNNFAMTPTNFNLLNSVYSQYNNFFIYRAVNPNKLNLDNFHNTITWTKTKTAGELIDTWTNVTLASTLELDGDKGDIRAIRRFNNNLIAFQDKGVSHILYNENMQVASTTGVPIEIANSGKVTGKRYISDRIGCTNKWSICETSNGIYFLDDLTKCIYLFNGQLEDISHKYGFYSWTSNNSKANTIWNPVDFGNIVTYYDKINGDIFFITSKECLAFSESLGQFSSFYSYENTPYFVNLQDKGIWIKGNKLWLHNEGDYNMYFGEYQPFYTTIIANPDVTKDKVFNNIEFRADSWYNNSLLNTTFDTLTTWNEYQVGTSDLDVIAGRPSNLKKKFRMWRANIPRDNSNKRDRMRNPWLYIKLSMEKENINKTTLHDIVVHYFE